MITVAIVAILAAVTYPAYTSQVRRTNRTDATSALLRIAAAQERFYIQNNSYTSTLSNLGITATERGFYTLSIDAGANATTFTARATAPTTSRQYQDTDCRVFTITHTGTKSATNAGGAASNDRCWR
jgi:type IV pilus assembly protein PilE